MQAAMITVACINLANFYRQSFTRAMYPSIDSDNEASSAAFAVYQPLRDVSADEHSTKDDLQRRKPVTDKLTAIHWSTTIEEVCKLPIMKVGAEAVKTCGTDN